MLLWEHYSNKLALPPESLPKDQLHDPSSTYEREFRYTLLFTTISLADCKREREPYFLRSLVVNLTKVSQILSSSAWVIILRVHSKLTRVYVNLLITRQDGNDCDIHSNYKNYLR